MKALIVSLLLLLFVSNSFAAIYQTRDMDGNIVFTDKPDADAQEKILKQPSVITIKKIEKKISETKPVDGLGKLKIEVKKALQYKDFAIITPENDKPVRNNIGNIELQLKIDPDLQIKFGHHIKVEYDGKMLESSWQASSILFTNLDRGTHTVQAYIVDKSGKQLAGSNLVTFHLLRFSRLSK